MGDIFSEFKSDISVQDIPPIDLQENIREFTDIDAEKVQIIDTINKEIVEQQEGIFKEFGFSISDFLKHSFSDSSQKISDNELEKLREEEFKAILDEYTTSGSRLGNCFSFACGFLKDPSTGEFFNHKPAPGDISGQFNGDYMPYFDDIVRAGNEDDVRETLETYFRKDCEACGKELIQMDSGDYQPKDGERLIAMMYSNRPFMEDFHFMVKGQYDTWYHKPGLMAPKCTDESGEIIYDPEQCDRGIYNHFCGYYLMRDKI